MLWSNSLCRITLEKKVFFYIYSPAIGQRQTLTVARSAHFHCMNYFVLMNPHLLKSFLWSNVSVDFFEFLFTKFDAYSKPPSRDIYRKGSYPRTQQRNQGAGWTQIMRFFFVFFCFFTIDFNVTFWLDFNVFRVREVKSFLAVNS